MIKFRIIGNDKFWNTDVNKLQISQRCYNNLTKNNIITFSDLAEAWDGLIVLSGFGKKTVNEVKNKFINYYIERQLTEIKD